jgi:hypothetical protein
LVTAIVFFILIIRILTVIVHIRFAFFLHQHLVSLCSLLLNISFLRLIIRHLTCRWFSLLLIIVNINVSNLAVQVILGILSVHIATTTTALAVIINIRVESFPEITILIRVLSII